MVFSCIGNVKYRQVITYQQQRLKSKRRKTANRKDCITFYRTTASHCCHSLLVVSQSIFAVYEMTQPLKFLNSVGLLGSFVYHYSAIKNQVCSTSDFSLQMNVFYRFLSHYFWPTKAPHIRVRTCEPCVQVATPLFSLKALPVKTSKPNFVTFFMYFGNRLLD